MKVLFVCSSNICRSPYCEFEFRRIVENDPVLNGQISISSGAVLNRMKHMDTRTYNVLKAEGFDPASLDAFTPHHISKYRQDFEDADVIIGMTKWHKYILPRKWRSKYLSLSEAATGRYIPVKDPWLAKTDEEYQACMDEIRAYLLQYRDNLKAVPQYSQDTVAAV